jgi:hypothetical protein
MQDNGSAIGSSPQAVTKSTETPLAQ